MKITYNWLKDYVDIKDSPFELAHLLTMAGSEVTSIEKKGDDFVLELEITPNRPDCLSLIGIAREVAAVTGKKLKIPSSVVRRPPSVVHIPLSIQVKDKKLCPRYSGRAIAGVKVNESPEWMQKRLQLVGLRPVNNIVDITNFCLFETGQPMHAFDYDKIKGHKVIVRCAEKGESINTIDGIKRELSPDMLIIADEERPIAIAGIMGGLDTEVSFSTKNILLESAYFDPVSIRRTSRRLGLSSESSYRFERTVDIGGIVDASNRAAILINELADGELQALVDIGDKKFKKEKIDYNVEEAKRFLGANISAQATKSIFKSLGFKVTGSKDKLKVEIPSYRQDLKVEVDLVEEAARIYGYDRIPSTIPEMISQSKRKDFSKIIQENIRKALIQSGLSEIVTYSLISRDSLRKLFTENIEVINVANPLSTEQEIMRPTLLVGMLNAILWNLNRKSENLKLFELSNAYFKDKKAFSEKPRLSIGLTGEAAGSWRQKRKVDFFDIKGVIENLLYKLGIEKEVSFSNERTPYFSGAQSASLKINGTTIGIIGKLKEEVLSRFDIDKDVYLTELEVDKILTLVNLKKYFESLPKFPFIKRDISIVLDIKIASSEIIKAIKELGISSIIDVEFFDEYYGKQVPEGKKSLSFSITYQDKTKTLTDEEVESAHSKVKETLLGRFSAQLR